MPLPSPSYASNNHHHATISNDQVTALAAPRLRRVTDLFIGDTPLSTCPSAATPFRSQISCCWRQSGVPLSYTSAAATSNSHSPQPVIIQPRLHQLTKYSQRCLGPSDHPRLFGKPTRLSLEAATSPIFQSYPLVVSSPIDSPTAAANPFANWLGARMQWLKFRWVNETAASIHRS